MNRARAAPVAQYCGRPIVQPLFFRWWEVFSGEAPSAGSAATVATEAVPPALSDDPRLPISWLATQHKPAGVGRTMAVHAARGVYRNTEPCGTVAVNMVPSSQSQLRARRSHYYPALMGRPVPVRASSPQQCDPVAAWGQKPRPQAVLNCRQGLGDSLNLTLQGHALLRHLSSPLWPLLSVRLPRRLDRHLGCCPRIAVDTIIQLAGRPDPSPCRCSASYLHAGDQRPAGQAAQLSTQVPLKLDLARIASQWPHAESWS